MDSPQNIISFCTGYGGIELGIKRACPDIRTVCYVEIEAFAQANLVAKIEQGKMDAAPVWSNLKTFPAQAFSGKVHGIIGGYPCQPFSHAGARKGTDDPRHLWPYIEEHIRTIRPVWCFFENVGGHLSLGFKEVFASLRDMGYKVEAGLFTAAEVGLPHKRERLFILAYSEKCRSRGVIGNGEIEDGKTKSGGTIDGRNAEFEPRGTELGNSKCDGCGEQWQDKTGENDRKRISKTASDSELAVTELRGHIHGEPEQQSTEGRIDALGDSQSSDREELDNTETTERRRLCEEHARGRTPEAGRSNRSPARPGQPQHEWEEPRTVKSGLGRTVNGFASRVDELRLLGNGVVPQTAELAFRTLWSKIIN